MLVRISSSIALVTERKGSIDKNERKYGERKWGVEKKLIKDNKDKQNQRSMQNLFKVGI